MHRYVFTIRKEKGSHYASISARDGRFTLGITGHFRRSAKWFKRVVIAHELLHLQRTGSWKLIIKTAEARCVSKYHNQEEREVDRFSYVIAPLLPEWDGW